MAVEHDSDEPFYDLLVIGAGIYGIQAARTYLELHSGGRVVVLEASHFIGGVWSRERVYNEFWTQTPLGILEFSDQPMHEVPLADQHYGFFKASHVSAYLEQYCESHVYDGSSLRSRIRLNVQASNLRKDGAHWIISAGYYDQMQFKASQVIDASGLTSRPNWPHLEGRDAFTGKVIHHKDFAKYESGADFATDQRIVVVGGAKSAADVAYTCAKAGKHVTWLIRESGAGPAAFVSAKAPKATGYANSNELFYTRITSILLASLFSFDMGYSRILSWINKSAIGQAITQRVWKRSNARAQNEANYYRPGGKANGFYNLKPDIELFWQNDSTGINQRDDFFDIIAKQVIVIRKDIEGMSDRGIILADEKHTCVPSDTVICATGWDDLPPYLHEDTAAELGLPAHLKASDVEGNNGFEVIQRHADEEVLQSLPILDSSWAHSQDTTRNAKKQSTMPYRLWKSIVPIVDPSVLFLGRLMLGNHFRSAEVQALFACAVLDKSISLPPVPEMEHDIARTLAWCRRRYLKKGESGAWFYWDMVPYTDMLLATLGLKSHRYASWTKDLFRPCFAKDLSGLLNEYKKKHETKHG